MLKSYRELVWLLTTKDIGWSLLVLEPLHGRHPLPVPGHARLHDLGIVHEAEHGVAGDVPGGQFNKKR